MNLDDRLDSAGRNLRARLRPEAPAFDPVLARSTRSRARRRGALGAGLLAAALAVAIPLLTLSGATTTTLRTAGGRTTSGSAAAPATKPIPPAEVTTVPDVVGQNKTEAMQTLLQLGLDMDLVGRIDPAVSTGTVIGQSPAPGSRMPRGGQVTVTVSSEGVPLDAVDWSSVTYPVKCGGTPVGAAAGYPEPTVGRQVAVVYVQCAHGAGSPPSAVLVYDYATSTTDPHLLQTLVSYQDDWSPAPNGLSSDGSTLSIHVYGYAGSAARCCPNVDTTLRWDWTGSSYGPTTTEPTHDTLPG